MSNIKLKVVRAGPETRSRASMVHVRQSRPDSGLGFQVHEKFLRCAGSAMIHVCWGTSAQQPADYQANIRSILALTGAIFRYKYMYLKPLNLSDPLEIYIVVQDEEARVYPWRGQPGERGKGGALFHPSARCY